jgi:hypothetical protein
MRHDGLERASSQPERPSRAQGGLVLPLLWLCKQVSSFGSWPKSNSHTVACPIRAQYPAQPRSLTANRGQPFSLPVRKLPSQSLSVLVFQAGHASSILVTRSSGIVACQKLFHGRNRMWRRGIRSRQAGHLGPDHAMCRRRFALIRKPFEVGLRPPR